jgi:putative ABC transport system permease protein
MNLMQSFLEALQSLSANKMRSMLTILGIVIGVGAVIALVSIGRGAQGTITNSIQGLGTNLLFVFSGGSSDDVRNPKALTLDDAKAIADPLAAPSVALVSPVLSGSANLTFGSETHRPQLAGVMPNYDEARNWPVTEGEFINEEHILGRASVVVLGVETANKLFGRKDGVTGESIRIEGQTFRVLGVLQERGGGAFGSQDDVAFVPLTTAQDRLIRRSTRNKVDALLINAISADAVPFASEEVAQILRTRHRSDIGKDDFTIFTQQDFLATAGTITNVLTIFLGGIAAISLLVGGIGIMNIMLVSVTERTREIGLRKAVGAHKSDILIQFLTESAALSLIGGVIGIGLGWLIAFIVGKIAEAYNAAINPSLGVDIILLATLFSAAVGLFFGIYPANRAANLEPVEALRYE